MAEVAVLEERRLLSAALAFAERGWHVFPIFEALPDLKCACALAVCGSPGKHPRTRRGFKDATCDPRVIREWWTRWPGSSVGIATGASALAVVDVDPRNSGDVTLADFEKRHAQLPPTLMALTGGGGLHYIYNRPQGLSVLKSRVLGQGLEFKADGGYIVAPPSSHVSGRHYAFDVGMPDEPGELPEWILEELRGSKPARVSSTLPPERGLIGAAFMAAGWARGHSGTGQLIVRCPWAHEHTSGVDYDTSTIVFPPTVGSQWGHFHCSHSHCHGVRSFRDVMDALPKAAVKAARESVEVDALSPILEDDPEPAVVTISGEESPEWKKSLQFTDKGKITNAIGNLAIMLANMPEWRGSVRYNTMLCCTEWARQPPSVPGMVNPSVGSKLQDHDYLYVGHWFDRFRAVKFKKDGVMDAIDSAARFSPHDPLTSWMDSIIWDDKQRLDTWLTTYLGVEETAYSRFVGTAWMLSAVARAYQPGCQVDYALVLEGAQGVGKTSALRILGGQWYLSDIPDIHTKDAAIALADAWIVEIPELHAMSRSDVTGMKKFLTINIDRYRRPYGRNAVDVPRHCVFALTTNERKYLRDHTGARRFWPVRVTGLRRAELMADREQLFAEAVIRYRGLEEWHPTQKHAEMLQRQQEERFEVDPWEDVIGSYLAKHDWPEVILSEFVFGTVLGIEPGKRHKNDADRLSGVMTRLRYERVLDGFTWHWQSRRER